MPNIDIGTFTFDSAAVEKNLENTRKKIFDLKEEQKSYRNETRELEKAIKQEIEIQKTLLKTTDKQSKEYKKAEASIASLNKKKEELFNKELKTSEQLKETQKEYRETAKIASNLKDENGNLISSQEAITSALNKENRSIAEARESNKQLLSLRNQLDLATEEGVVAMEKLNDKLNENNQFIKENVSGYEQQKINIGNYEGAVDGALGTVGEFVKMSQEAGGVLPLVSAGLSSAKTAMIGFTKSTIAFIATPLGALLAVIAGAFLLVQNALNRSEESTNKLSKALAPLSGLFNKLLSVLEPLGEFILDGIVKGFELAEESFYSAANAISSGLSLLGFDSAAKGVKEFTNEIKETAEASRDLAQAEADLEKAQRKQRLTQLEFQKEAEEFRQIRDDESLSIQERIQANEDLANVLNLQLQEEKRLAEQALLVANLRIDQEGETKEALDAQYAALTEIADLEERITGQRSEQLVNRNSLEREALDLVKERQDAAIEANEKELELFIAQQGFKEKSSERQLEIARETRDKEIAILEERKEYGKVSEIEYQTELINIKNAFLEQQRDLVIENAEREREELLRSIEERKTDYAQFTQERLDFEIQNSQDILDENVRLAELRLEQGEINEEQYQARISEIKAEARTREDEARLAWEEANKEREMIDLENRRILEDEQFENQFELRQARLERQRQQEIEAAEKTGADLALINQKYANLEQEIEEDKEQAKVNAYADTFGQASELLGKKTAAGKAAAIAEAFINTYNGVTQVWATPSILPEPFATIQRGVSTGVVLASGLKSVQNIKTQKAEKGYVSDGRGTLLRGKRHSGGGIQIEAEDGEPILTRKAFQMFPDLISEINVAGGGIPLAARGMLAGSKSSNNSVVQNRILQQIDMNAFSEVIADNVRQGAAEGSASGSMKGSQQGIIDLSDRRSIQQQAAF